MWSRVFWGVAIALAVLVGGASGASAAWMWDVDGNRIDDRIQSVESTGPLAARVGQLASGRLRFALMTTSAPFRYGVYIGYDHHPTDADAAALAALGVPAQVRYRSIDYIRSNVTFAQAQAVAQLPGITRIETIPILYPVNDIATQVLRARGSNGALHPSVWQNLGVTGRGAVVAILDSGVNDEADPSVGYPGHESLRGKFLGGGNFYSGDPLLNTPIGSSENPKHASDPEVTYHGTHVAGTAVGSGGPNGILNGAAPGMYAGLAPDARLVDCKALSDGGLGFGAADALDWCVAHRFDSWGLTGPDTVYRGIDVANLSLGGTDNSDGSDGSCAAVNAAHKAGIVVCVATGNDGNTGWMASPSAADFAVSVGSFTDNNTVARGDDIVADYSNEGPRLSDGDETQWDEMKPSVLGSGTGIVSALGDPNTNGRLYHHINGTSMACPSVAGVAALIVSAHPQLTSDQVRQILQNTADHRTDGGKQPPSASDPFGLDPNYHPSWGWGQVDAYAAVKEALNALTTQIVRIAVAPVRGPDGVRVDWWSQREYGLGSFTVDRAPDSYGGPGAWQAIVTIPVATPSLGILGVPNRHAYTHTDLDPTLDPAATYWYRVRWMDSSGRSHEEAPLKARILDNPVVARVRYSWTHNYSDGDLLVRYGSGVSTSAPSWFRTGPGAPAADSMVVSPGDPWLGTNRYYFHFDLTAPDLVSQYLPPSAANPWFLSVKEGGYINTKGRVNDFSVTVFNGAASTTYSAPNPVTETVEKQETVFWIPVDPSTTVNHAPVLAAIGPQTVGEGLMRRITLAATDADSDPLAYSVVAPPTGATFNPTTHVFEWTPGFSAAGTYSVRFRVFDNGFPNAAADSEDVTITVVNRNPSDNLAPLFDPIQDRAAFTGERLAFRISARDPEESALVYSAELLPAGATLDGASGAFEWTPGASQLGIAEIHFVATDPGGAADRETVYVDVTDPGPDHAPPAPCSEQAGFFAGVVGPGMDPGAKDVQYHSFAVPTGTQRIEADLLWFGGPVVDLDLYLLDPDGAQVQSAASLSDPEHLVYFTPRPGTYQWKVVAFTNPDTAEYSITMSQCVAVPAAVGDLGMRRLSLAAGVPNPFHTRTRIGFTLPRADRVKLELFDLAGRHVKMLADEWLEAGAHDRVWDRTKEGGGFAGPGIYFYRLEVGGQKLARKLVMVR